MTNEGKLSPLSGSGQWSTFHLAGEIFALRVEDVQEVLMQQPLTPVPLAPEHIVGLLNLRGHIMPAIDLRRRLRFPERGEDQSARLLVLKGSDGLLAIVVDGLGDVLELPRDGWRAPPDTLATEHRAFVFGICPTEQQIVLGLRVESLSDDDRSGRAVL